MLRRRRRARFARDPQTDRSLRHSIKDGVAYSVMAGAAETYFSAFALFLKAGTAQIAWLAALPPLLGSFAQLVSASLGKRIKRRKIIILSGAALQGVSLIPLVFLPLLFPAYAVTLLIVCAVVYFAGANLAAPQWSSLMGELVPPQRRGRYFGLRTRWASITTFLSVVAAGMTLHYFDLSQWTVAGFVVIFLAAAVARFVSIYHLAAMHDPPGAVSAIEPVIKTGLWQRIRGSDFARFSLFFAAMQFSVYISAPFFTVYMLRDLNFTYAQFVMNTAASVIMQFLTLNRWGYLSDVFGNRLVLLVTGAIIPIFPLLWLVSPDPWYLMMVQLLGGLTWAGFSLSSSNFVYDLIPPEKRATYLAYHNVLATVFLSVGALLGGYLGPAFPKEFTFAGVDFTLTSGLLGVFVVSSLMRVLVAAIFLPRLREVRPVRRISVSGLIFRVARVNPIAGMIFDVVGVKRRRPPK